MSLGLAFFLLCVVIPSAYAIAKCQAYLAAGLANAGQFGLAKGRENLGQWAIFRRNNYFWFLPMVAAVLFVEEGQTYSLPSPQAALFMTAFVGGFVGICRTFRDVLERRYGPSPARERGARIYAIIAAGGVALFVFIMELL